MNAAASVGLTLRSPLVFVRRDLRGLARGRLLYFLRTAVALIALIVGATFVLAIHRTGLGASSLSEAGMFLFRATLFVQLLLALFLSPLRGLAAVSYERSGGTWSLLALTRVGVVRALWGKLVSVMLLQLALTLALAPVQMLALCLGGVSGADVLYSLGVVIDIAFMGTALGLGFGFSHERPIGCVIRMLILSAILYIGIPGVLLSSSTLAAPPWSQPFALQVLRCYHPLVVIAVLFDPTIGVWAGLVGVFAQGVLFLIAASVSAYRSRGRETEQVAGRTLWQSVRKRLGTVGWLLAAFGLPALVTAWNRFVGGWPSEDLWAGWIGFECAATYVLTPLIIALPLARERERGTMPIMLVTPIPAHRIYIGAMSQAAIFLAVSVALQELQLVLYQTYVATSPGSGFMRLTLPVEVAAGALLPAAIAILASAVSRSVLASLGAAAAILATTSFGPFIVAMTADLLLIQVVPMAPPSSNMSEKLSLLSTLSVFPPHDQTEVIMAPYFATLAALVLMLGCYLFMPLQRWRQVMA